MRNAKFSLNAFILVVMIITGIFFFFSINVVDFADGSAINDYYDVEGSDVSICYSNLRPNGIYRGDKITGKLLIEGTYGHDWGAAAEGRKLYVNEYTSTTFGLTLCRLVKVDVDTLEKDVLFNDTILRGRCKSGELVCLSGFLMPTSYPKTNPLMSMYSLSSGTVQPENDGAYVLFIDAGTGEVVYSVWDDNALNVDIERIYLGHTLEEVRK